MASDINTEAIAAAASSSLKQEKADICTATENSLPKKELSMPSSSASESVSNYWRKAGTAVTGGVITAVGLVMIPAPTPCGCVVTAYGLSVLGREFEGAQRIVEGAKQKLEGGLDAWAKDWEKDHHDSDDDDDDDDKAKDKNDGEETRQKVDTNSTETDSGDSLAEESKESSANSESSNNSEMLLAADLNEGEADIKEDQKVVVHMNEAEKTRQEKLQLEKEQQKHNSTPNQSALDAWGKVWKSHSTNFRKGTSSFISNKLLPALRDIDLKHKKVGEEAVTSSISEQEETVTVVSEEEEEALVQIGDYEVIKLTSEEVKRIQEEIEGHSSNNDAIPSTGSASEVPASVQSMTSFSSTDEEASQDGEERDRLTT